MLQSCNSTPQILETQTDNNPTKLYNTKNSKTPSIAKTLVCTLKSCALIPDDVPWFITKLNGEVDGE